MLDPMPRKPKPKPDNPEQFKRFLEVAREVEVDEDPETLERALKRVLDPAKRDRRVRVEKARTRSRRDPK
jgi:hypothetical protein